MPNNASQSVTTTTEATAVDADRQRAIPDANQGCSERFERHSAEQAARILRNLLDDANAHDVSVAHDSAVVDKIA